MQLQRLGPAESQTVEQFFEPDCGGFAFAFEEIAISGGLIDYLLSDTEVASAELLVGQEVAGVDGTF